MDLLQAIFLAIVQGLTEFLPISSSGHLVFFQSLFRLEKSQLLFDVMLHLGTLLAVIFFFRADIKMILKDVKKALNGKEKESEGVKLLLWIILATLPTGFMGIFFHDWFESFFVKPKLVGTMLLLTGSLLWLTRYVKNEGRRLGQMRWYDSLLIGISQGIAIIPGISRSGATISTGLFCGLDRELSGRFSFLLSIPAILGATILEARHLEIIPSPWTALVGMIIAFGVGIFSLTFLMKIIKFGSINNFSYYCFLIGGVMVFLTK